MTTEGGNSGHEIPQAEPPQEPGNVPLDVWLDDQEAERRTLIMRLRRLDRILVRYGRLTQPTLPERTR